MQKDRLVPLYKITTLIPAREYRKLHNEELHNLYS
jgi:hypothetical protein